MAHFDTTPVDIFIIEAESSPVRLNVNGRTALVRVGADTAIARGFLPALNDCADLRYRIAGEAPPAPEHGAAPGPDFDPEAIIAGTVEDVIARLGGLTPGELEAVLHAEIDREVARVGVTRRIERAIADSN